jgi:chromosome segregation ATPase
VPIKKFYEPKKNKQNIFTLKLFATKKASESSIRNRKLEDDIAGLRKDIADLENKLQRANADNNNKQNQISALKSECESLSSANGALGLEKKRLCEQLLSVEGSLCEVSGSLRAAEDSKRRVEEALGVAESQFANEHRERNHLEVAKRKLESVLTEGNNFFVFFSDVTGMAKRQK